MPESLSHVLVPIDFCPPSREAVRFALEMAHGSLAQVTLLHVVPDDTRRGLDAIEYLHRVIWSHHESGVIPPVVDDLPRAALSGLEQQLHPEWRRSLRINTELRRGDVAEEVARFAEEQAVDLIVLGVRRTVWSPAMRRSKQILARTKRRVVFVHPRATPSPLVEACRRAWEWICKGSMKPKIPRLPHFD